MHLLLVEDDARLARLLTRLLEEDRHVVEHAPTDGRSGDRARRRPSTGIDAVDPRHRPAGHVRPGRRPTPPRGRLSTCRILMLTARDTVERPGAAAWTPAPTTTS